MRSFVESWNKAVVVTRGYFLMTGLGHALSTVYSVPLSSDVNE